MEQTDLEEVIRFYDGMFTNGYYKYFVLITFKDGTPYADKHPRHAREEFVKVFNKYMSKYKVEYELYFELSKDGRFHVHGVVLFKADKTIKPEKQYEEHEKELRLIRNWMNRRFGFNNFQQIQSFRVSYKVEDIKRFYTKGGLTTTFEQGYKYITKDYGKYVFLPPLRSFIILNRNRLGDCIE